MCNVDEILKQMKVLDALKQVRDNKEFLEGKFPELQGINFSSKLDEEITRQETDLEKIIDTCGKLDKEMMTEPVIPEPIIEELVEPELELPEPEEILSE